MADFVEKNWLTLIVAVTGVATSYFFYRRTLKRSSLAYQRRSIRVIGPNSALPNEVAIYFKDKRVPLVTKSIVVLWNSGNTTVLGTQATETDPLLLSASSGAEILDTRLHRVTRDVNAFKIHLDANANRIDCRFDFLDPKDGAVIVVLHTGESDLHLSGTFRGMPTGLVDRGPIQFQQRVTAFRRVLKIAAFVLAIVFLLLGGLLLYGGFLMRSTSWSDFWLTKVFGMVMGLAFTLPFLSFAYELLTKRRLPSKKLNVEDELVA